MPIEQETVFRQVNTPLDEAGFDESLYRKDNFFAQPISDLGKRSTPLTPNVLDNQISKQQILDGTIPDSKIVTNFRTVTNSALALDAGDTVLNCDTTSNAITLTLPDARGLLGKEFIIALVTDGGTDLTVSTDGVDQFDGATGATGTSVVFADVGDYLQVRALGNDLWLVLSTIGGTFS